MGAYPYPRIRYGRERTHSIQVEDLLHRCSPAFTFAHFDGNIAKRKVGRAVISSYGAVRAGSCAMGVVGLGVGAATLASVPSVRSFQTEISGRSPF